MLVNKLTDAMKRRFACKQILECPLNNVKVLLSDPHKGQIIWENVYLGHHDLIGVGLPDLVQVEAAGVNDSEILKTDNHQFRTFHRKDTN